MAEVKKDAFVVLKRSDLDALCQKSPEFAKNLQAVVRDYVAHRIATRGHAEDKYLVCNQDEPYAGDVQHAILNGEKMKEPSQNV